MYMLFLSLIGICGAITYLWLYIRQLEMMNAMLVAELRKHEASE